MRVTKDSRESAADRSGTAIATADADAIYVRGESLVDRLMGELTFTEMFILQATGRRSTEGQRKVVDAVMVMLMEHGLTPSAISARLVYSSSPEALQGAVAAGLLSAGSVFLGSMEDLALILQAGVSSGKDPRAYATGVVADHGDAGIRLAGFGHNIHTDEDPRAAKLLAIAADSGAQGPHAALLREISIALDHQKGRHITINATGAAAAVLLDVGFDAKIVRGFSLIARAAGLVGHLLEEQSTPLGRDIWTMVEREIPYVGQEPVV